jgi:glycosyltransferase involved in cell wall biosynthesis
MKTSMRIAIDTNCILPGQVGGIENYTVGLIEAIRLPQSPADELVLLTRPENHDFFARFLGARTAVVQIDRPLHNGQPVSNWTRLFAEHPVTAKRTLETFQRRKADLLRRLAVDLVHFPGNTVNPLDLDLPIVLNLHDLQHRHFPQYFSAAEIENREHWWRSSADRADALVAASNYVRDDLQQQWEIDPAKVFVTPDPLEAAFLNASPSEAQLRSLRERLELPESFFLYPAAVWPHKNHERLIRAFAAAKLESTQLLLTGGNQTNSSLPALISSLGLNGQVRLLGRVATDDLIGLYHLATSMILPSQHESWSIPVMEAMACGCPVACSNVTSLPEEVGDAGILFDPLDQNAMTQVMLGLASDAELRQQFVERGRERVKQFGRSHLLETLSKTYRYAVSAHRASLAA